jgi:hypothetical protein
MDARYGAGSCGGLQPLASHLEQESALSRGRDGRVQGVRHTAERADIVGIGGFLTDEVVLGGTGKKLGKPMDVNRRMHQQVQQEQERKSGFPSSQAKHKL